MIKECKTYYLMNKSLGGFMVPDDGDIQECIDIANDILVRLIFTAYTGTIYGCERTVKAFEMPVMPGDTIEIVKNRINLENIKRNQEI